MGDRNQSYSKPVVAPIPGTASLAHLHENVAAAGVRLEPRDLEALDAMADHRSARERLGSVVGSLRRRLGR